MDFLIGRQYGKGMSAHALKTIAIVAMVVDHVAKAFVPTASALGQIMHFIGRLTAPIMMFFVAEGYHHTRDVRKYALRLAVFALISHFPYRFFREGRWPVPAEGAQLFPTSVMYSLFVGLISLVIWNNDKLNLKAKAFGIFLLCVAAIRDGGYSVVLMVLAFGAYRGDFGKQTRAFCAIAAVGLLLFGGFLTWYQYGGFLTIPLLRQYNGTLGGGKHSKWFFYVFYPLHLFLLGLLKYGV